MALSLHQINLKNFRVFENLSFSIKPITILTGSNSSGKSSIVKALLLLQDNLKNYRLGQLDFTNDVHRLGGFETTINRNTQEKFMAFALQYKIENELIGSALSSFNNLIVETEYTFVPQTNFKMGILSTYKAVVKKASTTEEIFQVNYNGNRYRVLVNLERIAKSIEYRKTLALRPIMNVVRDSILPEIFTTYFAALTLQYDRELSEGMQQAEVDFNKELEINVQLITLKKQLSEAKSEKPNLEIGKDKEQEVSSLENAIQEIERKLGETRDEKIAELRNHHEQKIQTLIPGTYHSIIYNAILKQANKFIQELTNFTYDFDTRNHKDIMRFLEGTDWESQVAASLAYIEDMPIETIIQDIPDLSFLSEAKELLKLTLGDLFKGKDDESNQIVNALVTEIRALIKAFQSLIPFQYIDGIRGQQKRFYHLNAEYSLDKSIGLLLKMQNNSTKDTVKPKRGKQTENSSKKSNLSLIDKLLFIKKWLINWGIIEKDGDFKAKQIDGAFIDLKLYRTKEELEDGKATSIADLGLGISQLLPIIITTAYYLDQNYLIAIEEPESHLHPKLQSALADFMVEASEYGVRFLVETHSVYFIRKLQVLIAITQLKTDDLRICYINKVGVANTTSRQVEDMEISNDGTILENEQTKDLWKEFYDEGERLQTEKQEIKKFKTKLGINIKCLVLTEDKRHDKDPYLMTLLKASGFVAAETQIISYENCDKLATIGMGMAKYAQTLSHIEKIIFHQDADGLHDKRKTDLQGMCKGNNISKGVPFITHYNSIEGYFVNIAHILELFSGLSEEKLTEKIEFELKQLEKSDIERLKQKCNNEKAAKLLYATDPLIYCDAKKLIAKVNTLLQKYVKEKIIPKNPTLLQVSSVLRDDTLTQIAAEIWKK